MTNANEIMKRYLIYLLSIFLVNCASAQKSELRINDIDFIEIHKNESGMKNPTYKLSSEQIMDFVSKWNNSKSTNTCKYWSVYNITVHFKKGIWKRYKTSNNLIKEDDLYCFDIGSEMYFEKIWNQLNK
jgi:hypothetical protein